MRFPTKWGELFLRTTDFESVERPRPTDWKSVVVRESRSGRECGLGIPRKEAWLPADRAYRGPSLKTSRVQGQAGRCIDAFDARLPHGRPLVVVGIRHRFESAVTNSVEPSSPKQQLLVRPPVTMRPNSVPLLLNT